MQSLTEMDLSRLAQGPKGGKRGLAANAA